MSKHYKRLAEYKRKAKQTLAEKAMEDILKELGLKYISQKGFMTKNSFIIADFYLPKPHKLVIEVDGGYHEHQKNYDRWKDRYYKSRGFKVLRIKNESVLNDRRGIISLLTETINIT